MQKGWREREAIGLARMKAKPGTEMIRAQLAIAVERRMAGLPPAIFDQEGNLLNEDAKGFKVDPDALRPLPKAPAPPVAPVVAKPVQEAPKPVQEAPKVEAKAQHGKAKAKPVKTHDGGYIEDE